MKILNLYSGIGGNRLLWPGKHKVTAVEYDARIAALYKKKFPKDIVIVAEAHQYLLEHYKEFDLVWSSPPCQSHSKMSISKRSVVKVPKYFDLKLYQEIIFLAHYHKNFVVENVIPYYTPLIPAQTLHRHLFWCSRKLKDLDISKFPTISYKMEASKEINREFKTHKLKWLGLPYTLAELNVPGLKARTLINNCVHPKLGLHILNQMM